MRRRAVVQTSSYCASTRARLTAEGDSWQVPGTSTHLPVDLAASTAVGVSAPAPAPAAPSGSARWPAPPHLECRCQISTAIARLAGVRRRQDCQAGVAHQAAIIDGSGRPGRESTTPRNNARFLELDLDRGYPGPAFETAARRSWAMIPGQWRTGPFLSREAQSPFRRRVPENFVTPAVRGLWVA